MANSGFSRRTKQSPREIVICIAVALSSFAGACDRADNEAESAASFSPPTNIEQCIIEHYANKSTVSESEPVALGIALGDAESVVSQVAEHLNISSTPILVNCGYVPKAHAHFVPNEKFVGSKPATVPAGEYVIYNPVWIRETVGANKGQVIAIFGHELGHFINRDFIAPRMTQTSIARREEDADKFAGCAVAKMGADLKDLEDILSRLRTDYSTIYPDKFTSLAAAKEGFESCREWGTPNELAILNRIEESLAFALFQFQESKYLANARTLIENQSDMISNRSSLIRLSQILEILELSFSRSDISRTRNVILQQFESDFNEDPWILLLKAVIDHSDNQFSDCAIRLSQPMDDLNAEWPGEIATTFFKGVCSLKASREQEDATANHTLGQAFADFTVSEALAATQPDTAFTTHAEASSIVFQAIINFYQDDIEDAKREFRRASVVAEGSLKARTLSSFGFLEFIDGRMDSAELSLLDALEADPTFAYARSNYGYVLLARDRFIEAEQFFAENANDELLKLNSPRDVLLAQLAIGHARGERGVPREELAEYYSSTLQSAGLRDFRAIYPLKLRLAYQFLEMSEKVYLSKEYYGLEVFAVALMLQSQDLLDELDQSDLRVVRLSERIDTLSSEVMPKVPEVWMDHDISRGSFFTLLQHSND